MSFGMLKNHTGLIKWPLKGPLGESQTYAASSNFTFNLDDVPVNAGGKALYLAGVELDFVFTAANNDSSATAISDRDWPRILLSDIQLENTFMGTPVSSNHWKGTIWNCYEHELCGHRFWSGRRRGVATGTASQVTRVRLMLPLMSGLFTKSHHTAQLALLYKRSQLVMNTAATSVLTGLSTGAALSSGTIRATALLIAEPEIRLGPAVEMVDYQHPYAANNESIELRSFGNATGLIGTEQGAGLVSLRWLSSSNGQPGAGLTANVSRIAIPFRDQAPIQNLNPFFAEMEAAMGLDRSNADRLSDDSPFPYPQDTDTTEQTCAYLPLVTAYPDAELTKVQCVEGTQTYFLTISTGSGTHHTIAQHLRSWTPDMYEGAKKLIVDSGLARAVLGSNLVDWTTKLKNKQSLEDVSAKKWRFLPQRLVDISEAID
jgi:hypothetical protein